LVADELERPGGEPVEHDAEPHLPSPTIWPFAFAGGVALLLVGLIINWILAAIGAVIALVFGFLWIREATREVRRRPVEAAPPERASALTAEEEEEEEPERYPRSVFLEMSTLGVGALIGGIVTLPALGFMIAPAFVDEQGFDEVDLGSLENFPENQYVTATFFSKTDEGSVGRRTAFIRNNGTRNQVPSFTIISNRCAHLGCPTQPQGLPGTAKKITAANREVSITPVASVSGFQCPCHGGAYDDEGNRTAGPPVRALDRYQYLVRDGNLVLAAPYSVGKVTGKGANARIEAYKLADPGQHVDGPEQILYPPKFWNSEG
jgi:menaquinol-cytochrome c reductase iron-sulfur subunit